MSKDICIQCMQVINDCKCIWSAIREIQKRLKIMEAMIVTPEFINNCITPLKACQNELECNLRELSRRIDGSPYQINIDLLNENFLLRSKIDSYQEALDRKNKLIDDLEKKIFYIKRNSIPESCL